MIFIGSDYSSKVGNQVIGGHGHNPSTKHKMSYTASDNVITETCSCGCGHTANATLMLTSSTQFYTGAPIECGVVSYDADWLSGPVENIEYQNNLNVGTARASMTLEMLSSYEASANFNIIQKPGTSVEGKDPSGEGNVDNGYSTDVTVIYKVDQTYDLTIPSAIALGGLNVQIPVSVGVANVVIPVGHNISMQVASENGYKVKNETSSIAYSMQFGETTVTEGTGNSKILTVEWKIGRAS
jgi:hypothetical protein